MDPFDCAAGLVQVSLEGQESLVNQHSHWLATLAEPGWHKGGSGWVGWPVGRVREHPRVSSSALNSGTFTLTTRPHCLPPLPASSREPWKCGRLPHHAPLSWLPKKNLHAAALFFFFWVRFWSKLPAFLGQPCSPRRCPSYLRLGFVKLLIRSDSSESVAGCLLTPSVMVALVCAGMRGEAR